MNGVDPYIPSPDHRVDTERDYSPKWTRGAVALLETTIALCAMKHLIRGSAYVWRGLSTSTVYPEIPLVPSDLTEQWVSMSQDDLFRGESAIAFGIVLTLLGAGVWRYRRKLILTAAKVDGEETNRKEWFQRYALCGMAAAFLGFLSSPDVYGFRVVGFIRTEQISEFFALLGFGVSVLTLAIGWEARIRVFDGFLAYALAVIGVLLSCGLLAWMFLPFFHWLSRRFVVLGCVFGIRKVLSTEAFPERYWDSSGAQE